MYDWHPFTIRKLFEHIPISDLPDTEEGRTCKICHQKYTEVPESTTSVPWQKLPRPIAEEPIRLECGHIFGENCVQLWTFPEPQGRDQNSCPLCREPVFVLSEIQEERYQEELDDLEDEGFIAEEFTVVDFLCGWIEMEEADEELENFGRNEEEDETAATIDDLGGDESMKLPTERLSIAA